MDDNNDYFTHNFEHVQIGNVKTICASRHQLAQTMVHDCLFKRRDSHSAKNKPKLVFSLNGESIALHALDKSFKKLFNQADIIHADGMSAVFASRMTKTPLPERIATTDFFHDAAKAAIEAGLRFYFLGGTVDENQKAISNVRLLYPNLIIAGYHSGYFSEEEEKAIISDILASKTDVLWIALGRPRQESFAVRHQEILNGVGWIKTCGGLFKFLSGHDKRAPIWLQRMGFEWFYRMIKEPKRLFCRYLKTNTVAVYMLLFYTRTLTSSLQEFK